MMNVSGETILQHLEFMRDWYYDLAKKYTQSMARAEQMQDPIGYREAESNWWKYDHYGDAIQNAIDDLRMRYDEVNKIDDGRS